MKFEIEDLWIDIYAETPQDKAYLKSLGCDQVGGEIRAYVIVDVVGDGATHVRIMRAKEKS